MRSTLFHLAPVRPRRTLLVLLSSVVAHGLLIGVASLWPSRLAHTDPPLVVDFIPAFPGDVDLPDNLPASTPGPDDPLPPPPDPPTPVLADADDTPPPASDPDLSLPPAPSPLPLNHVRPDPTVASRLNRRLTSTAHPSAARSPGLLVHPGLGDFPGAPQPGSGAPWKISKPPYPYAMLAARVHGSGRLRITTNPEGQVSEAAVVQSCGSPALDDNTCRYARGSWSGPASSTRTVSFTYQLP